MASFSYSKRSIDNLKQCHPDLQKVFMEVIRYFDCSIIEGHRNKSAQEAYFHTGKSKLPFPKSKHNISPSMAVDVAPYPIQWRSDLSKHIRLAYQRKCYYFAGFVMAIAKSLYDGRTISYKIRWGGDWDSDHDLSDQTFNDLVHFELI